jgi:hypothetical protein
MQITTAAPAQIDAEIARIQRGIAAQNQIIDRALASTERIVASRYFDEDTHRPELDKLQGQVNAATLEVTILEGEVAPFTAEFTRRGGWSRYYLVEDGHLHYDLSSYRCSRQFTTTHYWMTDLSGQDAVKVVEMAGERACTNCFPDAPVAVLERPSQLQTANEAEKAAAAQERADKKTAAALAKAAKAITNPDGSDLVIKGAGLYPETIKTERAAMIELVDRLWYTKHYGSDNQAAIDLLLAALAAKHEGTVEAELAAAEKRLAAREKREAKFL